MGVGSRDRALSRVGKGDSEPERSEEGSTRVRESVKPESGADESLDPAVAE
jgi:hypothetical protein